MKRPDLSAEQRAIYIESVSVPVHMGSTTGKHEQMTAMIARAEMAGWRLEQMTSVYAEKLGINTLIHTMLFRAAPKSVTTPEPP